MDAVDVAFFRSRATEAQRQADGASSSDVRERCLGFVVWWLALAEAAEGNDRGTADKLTDNVVHFQALPPAQSAH